MLAVVGIMGLVRSVEEAEMLSLVSAFGLVFSGLYALTVFEVSYELLFLGNFVFDLLDCAL